jgi:hypothetical protein
VAVEIVANAGIENGELPLIAGTAAEFFEKCKAVIFAGWRRLRFNANRKRQAYSCYHSRSAKPRVHGTRFEKHEFSSELLNRDGGRGGESHYYWPRE